MDAARLAAEVERPALHRTVLGRFKGPYSLGGGRDDASAEPVLLLMVPGGCEATISCPGDHCGRRGPCSRSPRLQGTGGARSRSPQLIGAHAG